MKLILYYSPTRLSKKNLREPQQQPIAIVTDLGIRKQEVGYIRAELSDNEEGPTTNEIVLGVIEYNE